MPSEAQIKAAFDTLNQFHVLAGRITDFQVEAALRAALSPGQLVEGHPCPTCGHALTEQNFA